MVGDPDLAPPLTLPQDVILTAQARVRRLLPRPLRRFVSLTHDARSSSCDLFAGDGVVRRRLRSAALHRHLLELLQAQEAESPGSLEAEVRAAAETSHMVARVHELHR